MITLTQVKQIITIIQIEENLIFVCLNLICTGTVALVVLDLCLAY